MSETFPAELNRVARGWPIKAKCRQKIELAHAQLLFALATLHEAPTRENMARLNSQWAHAWRTLETCGEYKPGPSGTPSEGTKNKNGWGLQEKVA